MTATKLRNYQDEARQSWSGLESIISKNTAAAERFCQSAKQYAQTKVEHPCVLIVDDEPRVGQSLERCFEQVFGAHVKHSANVEQALALARTYPIHLVIVDLHLPGRPGWQLVEELRTSSLVPLAPVILISGLVDDGQLEEIATKCGANAFLHKPFELEALKAKVKHLFRLDQTGDFPQVARAR